MPCRGLRCGDGIGRRGRPRGLVQPQRRAASIPRRALAGGRGITCSPGDAPGDLPEGSPRRSVLAATGYGVHRVFRVGRLPSSRTGSCPSRHPRRPPVPRKGRTSSETGGRTRAPSWDIDFPTALRTFPGTLSRAGSSSRTVARAARACGEAHVRATLLTFDAALPGTYRHRRSSRLPDWTASPGFIQRTPLRRTGDTGVHSRQNPRGTRLRVTPATAPPRSALVVFHHLDGFLLRCRARVLQRAPDPGVHPVSDRPPRVAPRPLRPSSGCCPALRSLPSVRSTTRVTGVSPRRSPRALPPRPFPPPPHPTANGGTETARRDLEAFLHERVRCRTGGCPPALPGAPLGLPGSTSSSHRER
jgi:hypothetical protein